MSTLTITDEQITIEDRDNRTSYPNTPLGRAMAPQAVRERVERLAAIEQLTNQAGDAARKPSGRFSIVGLVRYTGRLAADIWRVLPRNARVAFGVYAGLGAAGYAGVTAIDITLRVTYGLGIADIFTVGLYYVQAA